MQGELYDLYSSIRNLPLPQTAPLPKTFLQANQHSATCHIV